MGSAEGRADTGARGAWVESVVHPLRPRGGTPFVLGAFEGEGVGPDVVAAALDVLAALAASGEVDVAVQRAPRGGRPAGELSPEIAGFCRDVFDAGGAVLAGAAAGRFVYDLRARFDLFCKLVPLRPSPALAKVGALKREHLAGVDVLLVRENVAGVYQGRGAIAAADDGQRRAEHTFAYSEPEVQRIVSVAARLARRRRGALAVVVKDGGVPAMTTLWRDAGTAIAAAAGVDVTFVNVDLAAYRLVQEPRTLDVVVAPNLYGDVLADVGAVLLGGRGLSHSGNFSGTGAAVYQTNHGSALDLAGTDRANPAGQILALAMLLRESGGFDRAAARIEAALEEVWASGWRTADVAEPGCRIVGTREMGARIADAVSRPTAAGKLHEASAAAG